MCDYLSSNIYAYIIQHFGSNINDHVFINTHITVTDNNVSCSRHDIKLAKCPKKILIMPLEVFIVVLSYNKKCLEKVIAFL